MRADAQRNNDNLLTAAVAAFSERGVEVSLEDVARRAGVGIGTLYRHFPTRDALIEAVYRREVELMCDAADDLLRRLPADEALAEWMHRFVRYVATKRGLSTALKAMVGLDSELFKYTHRRINGAVETVVSAAVRDGTIRADVEPADLLRGLSGICLAADPDLDGIATRLVGLLMDGLRFGARRPRTTDPMTTSEH